MIIELALCALIQGILSDPIALPVRKGCQCDEDATIAWPVRKSQLEDYPIALPVRKGEGPVALPLRKKESGTSSKKVAVIYSASSFRCPACESLEAFVQSRRSVVSVAFNKSEPSWVQAYPTVTYSDGHAPDNGQYLKAILSRM